MWSIRARLEPHRGNEGNLRSLQNWDNHNNKILGFIKEKQLNCKTQAIISQDKTMQGRIGEEGKV